jgi:hypothetical protein
MKQRLDDSNIISTNTCFSQFTLLTHPSLKWILPSYHEISFTDLFQYTHLQGAYVLRTGGFGNVTATLTVNYRNPIPLGSHILIAVRGQSEGRKTQVAARLYFVPPSS